MLPCSADRLFYLYAFIPMNVGQMKEVTEMFSHGDQKIARHYITAFGIKQTAQMNTGLYGFWLPLL